MESISYQPTKNGEYQIAIEPANMWRGAAGGVLGGGAGLVGGLLAGAWWGEADGCSGEDCGMKGAIVGAYVGAAVGLAVGTHYGSRGRGNLAVGMLTSTAIAVAGLYGIASAERAAPVILAVVPVLQFTALLAMER
jgi:hypothetical protein